MPYISVGEMCAGFIPSTAKGIAEGRIIQDEHTVYSAGGS